jgi:lipooligosaccharide transport system permease protein
MVTVMLAARAGRAGGISADRVYAVVSRNVSALRAGPSYWLLLVSGFFEPLLYLLSVGLGVGALVGELTLPDGRTMPYAAFVAPAMLATSAMSGAVAETAFNFFQKLKYSKTFDAVLATPVRPVELALGELAWATVRSALYAGLFLCVMVALGLTGPGWALAAYPAAILVGLAFGATGLAVSTVIRGWQDFDLLNTTLFALMFFSGTFAPVQSYPAAVEFVIRLTPLYHAVELLRGLTAGALAAGLAGHAAYLLVMTAAGLLVGGRRMRRRLCA